MKKILILLTTLILLLTCVLTACSGGENNTTTPDEVEKPNESSQTEDTSVPENDTSVPENDTSVPEADEPPVLKNSISQYFIKNPEGITVRDGLMVYTFNKDPNKSTVSVPFKTQTGRFDGEWKAYTYFNTLFYKQQFMQVVHSKPVFDEQGNVVSFDIISNGITMPFEKIQDSQESAYLWKDESESGYNPYVKITCPLKDNTRDYVQGTVDCSFTYEMFEDYKCRLYFPNGKTADYTVINKGNGRFGFKEHRFYATGIEIYLGKNQELELEGPYPYTGELRGKYKLYSCENGVAVTDIPYNGGKVAYEEPIYQNPESEASKTGTIYLGENSGKDRYNILYLPAAHGDDEELYRIYSDTKMKNLPEVSIRYYPTRNYTDENGESYVQFDVSVRFTWKLNGDCLTITYPNGYVVKKLLYKDNEIYKVADYPVED